MSILQPVAQLVPGTLVSTPPSESGDFRPADLVELTVLEPTIRCFNFEAAGGGAFPFLVEVLNVGCRQPQVLQASIASTTFPRTQRSCIACALFRSSCQHSLFTTHSPI